MEWRSCGGGAFQLLVATGWRGTANSPTVPCSARHAELRQRGARLREEVVGVPEGERLLALDTNLGIASAG